MATNVISLLQLVEDGWNMTMDVENGTKIINMQRNDSLFSFTERKRPNLCFLEATVVDTKFIGSVSTNDNIKSTRNLPSWDYNDFHDKVGHLGDVKLRAYSKYLGYKLTGHISACDYCNLVKSKVKSIPKITTAVATKVGERVGLDISGPFPITSGVNHTPTKQKLYWAALIDHFSKKMISSFLYKKNDLLTFVQQAHTFMKSRRTPI